MQGRSPLSLIHLVLMGHWPVRGSYQTELEGESIQYKVNGTDKSVKFETNNEFNRSVGTSKQTNVHSNENAPLGMALLKRSSVDFKSSGLFEKAKTLERRKRRRGVDYTRDAHTRVHAHTYTQTNEHARKLTRLFLAPDNPITQTYTHSLPSRTT
ncbi:hypothetical protein J6590_009160 [Homalodisca vitripennis]|nr:hypothetical protein J6590_009160 [Homalodisca vitripennis]